MRAVPARPPYLESKVQQPQFVFARRYSRETHADESKLIGVDGYTPPTAEIVERMNGAELKSHLARACELMMQVSEAYLGLSQELNNLHLRSYDEITKLRAHYAPTCQHEWGSEWRETNHAYRKCQWCHAIDKRAGGGAWTGD